MYEHNHLDVLTCDAICKGITYCSCSTRFKEHQHGRATHWQPRNGALTLTLTCTTPPLQSFHFLVLQWGHELVGVNSASITLHFCRPLFTSKFCVLTFLNLTGSMFHVRCLPPGSRQLDQTVGDHALSRAVLWSWLILWDQIPMGC